MEEKKKYGSSILEVDERDMIDEDEETGGFESAKITPAELSKFRNELRKADLDSGKPIKSKIYTDAITGIKSSKEIDETMKSESISECIDKKERLGKLINEAGINLIYELINTKPSEEEISSITEYFDKISFATDIYSADINLLKNVLGKRITDKILDVCQKNNVSEYEAITKFLNQIYSSYLNVIQYNNDVDELYDLVTNVSNLTDECDDDMSMDSLINISKQLNASMSKLKNLDNRNKRLRNDYKVTDFDILLVDEIKDCLDEAISFKQVYKKIDENAKKFRKDMKKEDKVLSSIENWIEFLKSDPNTMYTLPVNDFLYIQQSRDELITYIQGTIMLSDNADKEIPDKENVADVEKYYLDNGFITKNDVDRYKQSATLVLYLLSRTFKEKKIETNNDRRILSYTLDMISKLGMNDYRERFINLVNYATETILKSKGFLNISTPSDNLS